MKTVVENNFLILYVEDQQPELGDWVYNTKGSGFNNRVYQLDSQNSVAYAMMYGWHKILAISDLSIVEVKRDSVRLK